MIGGYGTKWPRQRSAVEKAAELVWRRDLRYRFVVDRVQYMTRGQVTFTGFLS